jgi:hypothetical protein
MRGSPCDSGRRGSTRLAFVCILTALPAFAPTAAAQNVNYGAAYDAIDRTAVYVSTWFDDAKATSVRRDDGSVDTIIEDGAANVLARAVHRGRSLDASVTGLGRLAHYTATLDSSSSYATDWFNKQLYVLWRDQDEANRTPDLAGRALALQWHRGHLRIKGQVAREQLLRMPDPVDAKPKAVRTQFRGYYAFSQRHDWPRREPRVAYASYSTHFYDSAGRQLGFLRYFENPKVVTWSFEGQEDGVAPEWRLPDGYKFEPNMAWAGIQAMAFHQSGQKARSRTAVGAGRPAPSRWARVASGVTQAWGAVVTFMVPAVYAQSSSCDGLSDGCTGLHFLDGTIFQQCCDTHDKCFEVDCTSPCTKWSWIWPFGQWDCAACNANVVKCFFTTAFGGPGPGGGGSGGGGGGSNPCADNGAAWCPPECMTCIAY